MPIKAAVGRSEPATGTLGIGAGVGVAVLGVVGVGVTCAHAQSGSETQDGFRQTPEVLPDEIRQIMVLGQSLLLLHVLSHCGA